MTADSNTYSATAIDLPLKTLEVVTDTLARVGINPPPFFVQFFLLVLTLVVLGLTVKKIRAQAADENNDEKSNMSSVVTAVGLGLIAGAILFAWGEQVLFPFPKEIRGTVEVTDADGGFSRADARVVVLDYRDNELGSSLVDTTNGNFAAYWEAGFGVRPRKIRVLATGCDHDAVPITHDKLRQGRINIKVNCGG